MSRGSKPKKDRSFMRSASLWLARWQNSSTMEATLNVFSSRRAVIFESDAAAAPGTSSASTATTSVPFFMADSTVL